MKRTRPFRGARGAGSLRRASARSPLLRANAALRREVRLRRLSEASLTQSEAKFRAIYEQSPVGLELFDPAGRLVHVNPACMKIFGLANVEDVKGFRLFGDPNLPPEFRRRLRDGLTTRYEIEFDFDKVHRAKLYPTTRSGRAFLSVICSPLRWHSRAKVSGYLVQVSDVTDRKLAEESMRLFRLRLVVAREEERKLLARELHDSLGQKLFAARLKTASIVRRRAGNGEVAKQVSQLTEQFTDIFNDIRQISRALYPQSLETLGLVGCLRVMMESLGSGKTRLVLRTPPDLHNLRIAPAMELALFRIAQESITNAMRHARASRITVSITSARRQLRMTVVDNGRGFSPQKMQHKGLGLASMKDRAEMVDGSFEISSRPGRTCVEVRLRV